MAGLILSFQFFTRIPLPIKVEFSDKNISRAIGFFPVVALFLAFIYSLALKHLNLVDREISALFVLILMTVLTGGLHLDGLSDMADGFFSGKGKKQSFEIMKDSRIGAFGVMALIIIFLLKFTFLKKIGPNNLFFSTINSRISVYILILLGKAPGKGLGDSFQRLAPKKMIVLQMIIYGFLVFKFGIINLITYMCSLVLALLILFYSNKKIGGVNGDINGAYIEISEVVNLILYWGLRYGNIFG